MAIENPMEFNTLSGEPTSLIGSVGRFAATAVGWHVGESIVGRPLGLEWSGIPGATRMKNSSSKLVRGIGKAGQFGSIPDLVPLDQIGAMRSIKDFSSAGGGPIFSTGGRLFNSRLTGWTKPGADFINNAYMGNDISGWLSSPGSGVNDLTTYGIGPQNNADMLRDIYDDVNTGNSAKSIKGRKEYFKNVRSQAREGTLRASSSSGKQLSNARFNRAAKGLADLELRGLNMAVAGRALAITSGVAIALTAIDTIGGIAKFGYEKGLDSVAVKRQATEAIRTPSGETYRMRALQQAAASFGAMRAGMGNEAMSYHRYS